MTTQGHDPRIKNLEDEQEILSNSLQALTSHFAQVQFRLRQIVEAPAEERDLLLESLEELANRGIPEVTKLDPIEHEQLTEILVRQQERQFELIDHLKKQLSNVEKLALDSGAPILPQSVLVEKQKVIIEELKKKLNINVSDEELPQLSIDDIRSQIDSAFGSLVQPLKMKETLVNQLKTQVVDLERFVAHLQCETTPDTNSSNGKPIDIPFSTYNSKTAKKTKPSSSQLSRPETQTQPNGGGAGNNCRPDSYANQNLTTKVSGLIDRATAVLNIFAETQLGCNNNRFQKNTLKKTTKFNHWGDLRAQLEVDVQEIVSLLIPISDVQRSNNDRRRAKANFSSDSDDDDNSDEPRGVQDKKYDVPSTSSGRSSVAAAVSNCYQSEITTLVRKNFSVTLQKLMQHGLRDDRSMSSSLVPFMGCFRPFQPPRNIDELENRVGPPMHVWELILEYYYLKNGSQFNETPARKLSESFNLDISGIATQVKSNKHTMLSAIGSIIAMHAPYKRSQNSHFKAFVSAGLK